MRTMVLLLSGLLSSIPVPAANAGERCPSLPAGSGLHWEVVDGPDFVFCKAIRSADGVQALSVMLGAQPSFRPDRSLREGDAMIDGRRVRWYRGDMAGQRDVHVRETVLELGRRRAAHVVVRADSEQALARHLQVAGSLRFDALAAGGG